MNDLNPSLSLAVRPRVGCRPGTFLLPVLMAVINLIPADLAPAQTFTTLYNFTNSSDGGGPLAGLILSGSTLYGTASSGGIGGNGTVFAMNTNGAGYTNLHSFNGGSDGYRPSGGLVLLSNTLYGTAYHGGNSGNGTIFSVNTNGTDFTTLYNFSALSN